MEQGHFPEIKLSEQQKTILETLIQQDCQKMEELDFKDVQCRPHAGTGTERFFENS